MIWILLANDGGARLFETKGPRDAFRQVRVWENPQGKWKDQDFDADRPGRSFDSSGTQRHAMEREVNPHRQREQFFSHQLAAFLYQGLTQKHFDEWVLIAPPHLLGILRKELSEPLRKSLRAELAKDFPDYMSEQELFEHFFRDLGLGAPA